MKKRSKSVQKSEIKQKPLQKFEFLSKLEDKLEELKVELTQMQSEWKCKCGSCPKCVNSRNKCVEGEVELQSSELSTSVEKPRNKEVKVGKANNSTKKKKTTTTKAKMESVDEWVKYIQGSAGDKKDADKKKMSKKQLQEIRQLVDKQLKLLKEFNDDLVEVERNIKQVHHQVIQLKESSGKNKKHKIAAAEEKLKDFYKRRSRMGKEVKTIFSEIRAMDPDIDLMKECCKLSAIVVYVPSMPKSLPAQVKEDVKASEDDDVELIEPTIPLEDDSDEPKQLYKIVGGKLVKLKQDSVKKIPSQTQMVVEIMKNVHVSASAGEGEEENQEPALTEDIKLAPQYRSSNNVFSSFYTVEYAPLSHHRTNHSAPRDPPKPKPEKYVPPMFKQSNTCMNNNKLPSWYTAPLKQAPHPWVPSTPVYHPPLIKNNVGNYSLRGPSLGHAPSSFHKTHYDSNMNSYHLKNFNVLPSRVQDTSKSCFLSPMERFGDMIPKGIQRDFPSDNLMKTGPSTKPAFY